MKAWKGYNKSKKHWGNWRNKHSAAQLKQMLRKQTKEGKHNEWSNEEMNCGMSLCAADSGCAAYNPPKARASRAANKLISFHKKEKLSFLFHSINFLASFALFAFDGRQ